MASASSGSIGASIAVRAGACWLWIQVSSRSAVPRIHLPVFTERSPISSKTGSGAYHFKRNWGFEPEPLSYATWTAPGYAARDADPTSQRHAARIALWKRLPLPVANRLGPLIARGLG